MADSIWSQGSRIPPPYQGTAPEGSWTEAIYRPVRAKYRAGKKCLVRMSVLTGPPEDRRQKTDDGRQKTEDRRQKRNVR